MSAPAPSALARRLGIALVVGAAVFVACASEAPETRRPRRARPEPAPVVEEDAPEPAAAAPDAPRRAPAPTAPKPRALMRVHLLDVGQGAAALLELPCAAILVDTGGEENALFHGVDALVDQLDRFFEERADLARTIKLLVLTHPHIDHLRGVPAVLERYRVENIVDNGHDGDETVKDEMRALRAVTGASRDNGVGYRGISVDAIPMGGALTDDVIDPVACPTIDPRIQVLWGGLDHDPGWGENRYGDRHFANANNHSVVTRVDFGESSILITGDLEEVGIRTLRQRGLAPSALDTDVYVVGHHGSYNGTTKALLEDVTPELALISMGPSTREVDWSAWRYGHPRRDVVELLAESVRRRRAPVEVAVARGAKRFDSVRVDRAIYGTGWDGTVVVRMFSDGVILVEDRPAPVARRVVLPGGPG